MFKSSRSHYFLIIIIISFVYIYIYIDSYYRSPIQYVYIQGRTQGGGVWGSKPPLLKKFMFLLQQFFMHLTVLFTSAKMLTTGTHIFF